VVWNFCRNKAPVRIPIPIPKAEIHTIGPAKNLISTAYMIATTKTVPEI
jgi:hypothetical protein